MIVHRQTGDLEIVVGMEVPQGDLANVLVEASNPTLKDRATFPLAAFVRGATGEMDTTFGENGIVSSGTFSLVEPTTGELYVGDGTGFKRYDASGKVVGTGEKGGDRSTAMAGAFLYSCGLSGTGGEPTHIAYASRVSIPGGVRDTTYSQQSPERSGRASFRQCLAASTGSLAVIGYTYGSADYGLVTWFDPAGFVAEMNTAPSADRFENGVFVADGIVVSTATGIAKIKTGATALDTSFANSGRLALSSEGPLTHIVEGPDKKLIGANATYTVRVTATGGIDGTFIPAATTLTPTTGVGKVAVQSDGRIVKAVQLGTGDGRVCAVIRYMPTGALDTSFGNQGVAALPTSPCSPDVLAVRPDKKIIVGGPKVMALWD